MNLLRAITTVGGYTMLSRVFGFVRDILIAATLGAGTVADAFFVAFRLPNLFRRLFAEGAFAAAFVPIFSSILEKDGRAKAQEFAEQAFAVLFVILALFVAAVEMAMPLAVWALATGFDAVEGKMELATELSRIAFPYLLFISLVSLQSGVLNSLGRFAAAAAAPVLLNLVLIAAMLGFGGTLETPGHVLSWGVFAAGVVQFGWLLFHCRRADFPIKLRRPRLTPKVRLLGRRTLPVVFGASLYQISLLIGTNLASQVGDGAVSFLWFADRVVQLPLGVAGVAVGTALLPALSRQLSAGDEAAASQSQNRGLEFSLLLTVPAAIALLVIAMPIVTVLFEHGKFGPAASRATANALMAYATGLPAYVLIKVLTPGFFAREDTKTPVRIAAAALLVNIVLNLIFMRIWGHVGIALATSVAAWVNAAALAYVLRLRGHLDIDARLAARFPRIVLASLGMAAGLFGGERLVAPDCAGPCAAQVPALAVLIAAGLVLYTVLVQVLGAARWSDLRALRRKPDAA